MRLPHPRALHRRAGRARWAWAVLIAVGLQAAVVVALAHLSHQALATPTPPLVVRSLRTRPPELPPPPAPARPRTATPAAARLPSLDLPAMPTVTPALTLPLLPPALSGDRLPLPTLDLAVALPAIGAEGPLPALPPTVDPDQPATLEGTFDLERFYPRRARTQRITGSTTLHLSIGVDGQVTAVAILASTPPGVFEDAARRLAATLRYRPAVTAGHAVPSDQRTAITWTLR